MILEGKNSNDIYKCNNEANSEKASVANIDQEGGFDWGKTVRLFPKLH